jgi:hypothetical protein
MERYPWYSCDSSSWIQSAAFGSVVMPGISKSNPAWPMSVSEKSPSRHDAGMHATTLSPIEVDHVFKFLEQNGFTYERLSQIYESRAAFNLWAFGVINTMMNASGNAQFRESVADLFA